MNTRNNGTQVEKTYWPTRWKRLCFKHYSGWHTVIYLSMLMFDKVKVQSQKKLLIASYPLFTLKKSHFLYHSVTTVHCLTELNLTLFQQCLSYITIYSQLSWECSCVTQPVHSRLLPVTEFFSTWQWVCFLALKNLSRLDLGPLTFRVIISFYTNNTMWTGSIMMAFRKWVKLSLPILRNWSFGPPYMR